jgi:hypothetical protein
VCMGEERGKRTNLFLLAGSPLPGVSMVSYRAQSGRRAEIRLLRHPFGWVRSAPGRSMQAVLLGLHLQCSSRQAFVPVERWCPLFVMSEDCSGLRRSSRISLLMIRAMNYPIDLCVT